MLTGKTIVITGAASGIGAACSEAYRRAGATVIATDLRGSRDILTLDVSDPTAWGRLLADLPPVDVLHLNAGRWTPGYSDKAPPPQVPLADIDLTAWHAVFSANVDGVFNGMKAVLPQMVERRDGDILVTASMAGLLAPPGDIGYGTTKHAVVGLVRAVAQALDSKGVAVSALCPAAVDTPMVSPEVKAMMGEIGMPVSAVETVVRAAFRALEAHKNGSLWPIFGDLINQFDPPDLDEIIEFA